jgi:hypothetical protein
MDTGAIGKAQALRLYARQRKDAELEMQMAEIRLRAYRRIGEISSELERTDEDTRFGSDGVSTGGHPGKLRMLKNAGITHAVAVRCETVASIPEAEFYAFIARYRDKGRPLTINELLRMVGKAAMRKKKADRLIQKAQAFPNQRYHVLYADPPWR